MLLEEILGVLSEILMALKEILSVLGENQWGPKKVPVFISKVVGVLEKSHWDGSGVLKKVDIMTFSLLPPLIWMTVSPLSTHTLVFLLEVLGVPEEISRKSYTIYLSTACDLRSHCQFSQMEADVWSELLHVGPAPLLSACFLLSLTDCPFCCPAAPISHSPLNVDWDTAWKGLEQVLSSPGPHTMQKIVLINKSFKIHIDRLFQVMLSVGGSVASLGVCVCVVGEACPSISWSPERHWRIQDS